MKMCLSVFMHKGLLLVQLMFIMFVPHQQQLNFSFIDPSVFFLNSSSADHKVKTLVQL